MTWYLDLYEQVIQKLAPGHGGTGNAKGWSRGHALATLLNRSASVTLPVGSVVQVAFPSEDPPGIALADGNATILGILVGYYDPAQSDILIEADCPPLRLAGVLLSGISPVKVAAGVTKGQWAHLSGTAGQAMGDVDPTDSFGRFLTDGGSDHLVPALIGRASSGAAGSAQFSIPDSIIAAKGDLIAGEADDLPARLPVGLNEAMLVADSTQTLGLRWYRPTTFLLGSADPTTSGGVPALIGALYIRRFLQGSPPGVSFIGVNTADANEVALPGGAAAGDVAIAAFWRNSATSPGEPTGWTTIAIHTASLRSVRVCRRILQTGDTGTGISANATLASVWVGRGYDTTTPTGAASAVGGVGSTVTIPSLTLQVGNGTSWIVGFGAAIGADGNDKVKTPTGLTNRTSALAARPYTGDSDEGRSTWAGTSYGHDGGNTSWAGVAVEVRSIDADADSAEIWIKHGLDPTDWSLLAAGSVSALDDLADVDVSSTPPTDGQVLTFDDSDDTWKPATPPGAGSGIPESLLDAKGDLIVASADDTAARLAVGSNGQVLTADSGETLGVKWAAGGGGSLTVEEADGTPSVANVSKIKVGNGDLTDEGSGVVRVKTAADAAGGGGSDWALIATHNVGASEASVEFLNLGAYSAIRVIIDAVTASTSNFRVVQVSTDNGSTWKQASGDYERWFLAGSVDSTTLGGVFSHGTAASTARVGLVTIDNFNQSGHKPAMNHLVTSVPINIVKVTDPLDAVRVVNASTSALSGNLTGGTIRVYGKAA